MPEIVVKSEEAIRSWAHSKLAQLAPQTSLEERTRQIEAFISRRGWQALRSDLQKDINNSGVLCLSESWGNPQLWQIYGQEGAGVCVEFHASGTTFFGETRAFKIRYADPASLGDFEVFTDDYWEQIKRIVLTKGTRWSDEREWRFLMPGNQRHRTVGLYVFPHDLLASVILGPKISHLDRRIVLQWLSGRNPRPTVYQAHCDAFDKYSRTRIA